ncbi:MAG TPA: HEAT repeat domain-containing protein [Terriglobia bacterium]|nr:HEAT repeat domain-containing protein [Terriglobia bacterium]
MLTLDRVAAELAWPMATALFMLLGALIAIVVIRRARQRLQSRRLQQARSAHAVLVEEVRAGRIGYEEGLARLRALSEGESRSPFEDLLMADKHPPAELAALLARLCEDLGLVAGWQRTLTDRPAARSKSRMAGRPAPKHLRFGPLNFVLRSEAAEKLGIIRHQASWPVLVNALNDPNLSVRSAAARALARIQEPLSLPALTEQLEDAVLNPGSGISVGSSKMALACFPLVHAAPLRRLLEHADRRVRAVAADVVSIIFERAAAERPGGRLHLAGLAPELAEIFVTRLAADECPDVRARACDVIARLDSSIALPPLLQLADDFEWYVRLHAVRALGRLTITSLTALRQRLTDRHWRVREAAAQTLSARGARGLEALLEHFLTTEDRYSQEQVAEQIARAALMPACLEALAAPGGAVEARFVARMTRIGYDEAVAPNLGTGRQSRAHAYPEKAFARHPNSGNPAKLPQGIGADAQAPGTPERGPAGPGEPVAVGSAGPPALETP